MIEANVSKCEEVLKQPKGCQIFKGASPDDITGAIAAAVKHLDEAVKGESCGDDELDVVAFLKQVHNALQAYRQTSLRHREWEHHWMVNAIDYSMINGGRLDFDNSWMSKMNRECAKEVEFDLELIRSGQLNIKPLE